MQSTNKLRAKVQDHPSLERDMSTGGVINNNRSDYARRMAMKAASARKNAEIRKLETEVAELKELVHQLLQNR